MINILVTGGNGFVGKRFIDELKKNGYCVYNFDLSAGKNILDYMQVYNTIDLYQIDIVWHFAAVSDLNIMRDKSLDSLNVNVMGTSILCKICAEKKIKLNYISTCCVYGNQNIHPSNEIQLPNPSEIYAASKLAGENIILGYNRSYDLKYNILRVPTMYGPGMRSALGVYVFIDQAIKGLPITIHGDGKQTRTLTYVDDVIEALVLVQKKEIENQTINISTKEIISANYMAKKIKVLTGSKSKIIHIQQRKGQTLRENIDITIANHILGWNAKTSFDKGLKKTLEWYKQ